MVKYLIYPIIKYSLYLVLPIRGLQSFFNLVSSFCNGGWMMTVDIWRALFLVLFLEKRAVVCSTMAATVGEINLISKWFAMIVCSAWAENWIDYHIVWEWHEDHVWRECLVARICAYTWISRWSLI